MDSLISAFQFLTILHLKKEPPLDSKRLSSSWVYFPLVGAFLGLVLILLDKLLFPLIPSLLLGLILVFTLVILTGAMHIDGLADFCDAFFCGKNKEEALSIMRDTHKGTFGALGITADILFKALLLSYIPVPLRVISLILMAVLSRYAMSMAIAFFPYARNEGKAKLFFQAKSLKNFFFSTLFTLVILALAPKLIALITLICTIIFTFLICAWINKRISGLTGDTLGALCEINELITLSAFFILGRINF